MNEQQCLSRMKAPGDRRPGKYMEGVCQIRVTGLCDKACNYCTQASQFRSVEDPKYMPLDLFEQAVLSLKDYFGVVGVFGGNPALHPQFEELCDILIKHIPFERRGLWCNNPINESKCQAMRRTFNPAHSNLNVHRDRAAFDLFKFYWPEAIVVGLNQDSRHSPCQASMTDLSVPEGQRWELISDCDINQHWSPMIGMFRGELRAWFCEEAGAQAILKQYDTDYPDTGFDPTAESYQFKDSIGYDSGTYQYWWQLPMTAFARQVREHCHNCAVPLRGYGALGNDTSCVQLTTSYYADVLKPKGARQIQVSDNLADYRPESLHSTISYLQNSAR